MPKLLTFHCQEPVIHALSKLGWEMVVVTGAPGQRTSHWDRRCRPVPRNARVVSLGAAFALGPYDAVIAHSLEDLLSTKELHAPRVFVAHTNLRRSLAEQGLASRPAEVSADLRRYLTDAGGVAVGASEAILQSWGVPGLVIPPAVDPEEYSGYVGSLPRGLRVANQVSSRRAYCAWNEHERIVAGLEFQLVGNNPDMGTSVASSFDSLRATYREHRYYVHTQHADADGYNLSLLEAMATGMPIVSTPHRQLPLSHGLSGYVSNDVQALRRGVARLLEDQDLARAMGAAARREIREMFAISRFIERWHSALRLAKSTYEYRCGGSTDARQKERRSVA